jgi:hypothetical protein
MADITVDVNWEILPAREVLGNGANRFDCWRQNDTLGPYPPTAESGPPETEGEPGNAPTAGG